MKFANRNPATALEIEVDRQQTTTAGWQIALLTCRVCTMQSYKEMAQTINIVFGTTCRWCIAVPCSMLNPAEDIVSYFVLANLMVCKEMTPQRRRDLLGFDSNT